jgi:DNA-binding transcriptional regulator of glucitol operon
MDRTATFIIIGLALAWGIQYVLAFFQMRRYYKRIAELRRLGKVATGVAGSSWRRRQYAVLVVDANDRIVHVEELSGWTVFAVLKPVKGLDGRPLSDLDDETLQLPVSEKLLVALRNAASYLKEASNKAHVETPAEDGQMERSAAAG